ncbi:MAG: tyrosine protein phosphatase [Candidatus Nealsonbacteria bacterium]|nr:tyrosine protein phosphatase [Candidatus Nealsonbacteria bacterium]
MSEPPPLVDIHCHLLPGTDDGASDAEETLAMARLAVDDGISTVVATPHQLECFPQNQGPAILDAVERVRELLLQHNVPLTVVPGGEVRIVSELVRHLHSGKLLTLANRGRHVLLELPHDVYFPFDRLIYELSTAGMVAVLAHPERNPGIARQRGAVPALVKAGCLIQITAGSLVGSFGPRVQKFARSLVSGQLAHFVGTDAHGAASRRPLLRRAFDCVSALAGRETAVDLCCRNPASVVAGEDVPASRGRTTKADGGGWFRRRKAG